MLILSSTLDKIKPSITLLLNQRTISLKKQGVNIISFGIGEPDFDTPDNIKFAAIKAIVQGHTKYTNFDGVPELKIAISNKFKRENNLDYDPEQIIVSSGSKHVIYNLFMATLNEGDEVIIPRPYWASYPDMVILNRGTPVFAECDNNFKITPNILDSKISQYTKWLILNSPNNPSGACYTPNELRELANVLKNYPNVHIMSDDIYEHIVFDNLKFCNIAQVAPEIKDRVFTINGVSKAYSMTGWRVGYGAGDKAIIKAMGMVQSQSTANACSISQMAAIEALNGTQHFIAINNAEFQHKRDIAVNILSECKYLQFSKPHGAFYLFVDCRQAFGKMSPEGQQISSCDDFSLFLLNHARVAVVPGMAFGLAGFVRMSFATSVQNIEQGCKQIVNACNNLLN